MTYVRLVRFEIEVEEDIIEDILDVENPTEEQIRDYYDKHIANDDMDFEETLKTYIVLD